MLDDITIPEAHCPTHRCCLTVERNHCAPRSEAWKCYCPMCVDYDDEGPRHEIGVGPEPTEAIEGWADNMGVNASDVIFRGEMHV